MRLSFTVPGIPQSAGSKRAFPFKRKDGKGKTVLAWARSDWIRALLARSPEE